MGEELTANQRAALEAFWHDRRHFQATASRSYRRPLIPKEFNHILPSESLPRSIDAVEVRLNDAFSEGPPHPRGFVRYRTLIVDGERGLCVHDAEDAVNWLLHHGPPAG